MAEMTREEVEYLRNFAYEKEQIMKFFTGIARILSSKKTIHPPKKVYGII